MPYLFTFMFFIFTWSNYLWFDEAGQYYISRGLNHTTLPFSSSKGLRAVWQNNLSYNLDPGLYSVLLFFWLKIGQGYLWVKLLPLVFSLAFIKVWNSLLNLVLLKKPVLLIQIAPILIWFITAKVGELRPYMLEYIVTLIALRAVIKGDLTNIDLMLLSLGIWSRYTSVIVVSLAIASIVIGDLKRYLKRYGIYMYLFSFGTMLLTSYPVHSRSAENMSYLVERINFDILSFSILFLFAITIFLATRKKLYPRFIIFSTLLVLTFAVLGYMGKHPFTFTDARCGSMVITILLAAVIVINSYNLIIQERASMVISISVLLMTLYISRDSWRSKDAKEILKNLEQVDTYYIVPYEHYPSLKYELERGTLDNVRLRLNR